jgi:hypothetical protein
MPNVDHHAIVVGVTHYPSLGGPGEEPPHLKGPENDADDVLAWLTSKSGGDVPRANITLIKSSDFAQAAPNIDKPTRDQIDEAFAKLYDLSRDKCRRLYIYMSGHGFSPKRNHGCLIAANATSTMMWHVYPSGWLEALQESAHFDEFVLWMDCCMNRFTLLSATVPPTLAGSRRIPAGPTFIAFAAQRPLKAVEREFPEDKKVHGVFTRTLLEGLRGAAADRYGMVTGRSLADWLRNAQRPRMDKRDTDDPDVAEEPEVAREDSGVIFARGIVAEPYKVTLLFPPGAQGCAHLWCGRPCREAQRFEIKDEKPLRLPPGLYVLDAPDAGLRHGFEVIGPGPVKIYERGARVVTERSSDILPLDITPADKGAEIFILDERFALVDRSVGSLHTRLPFGIYKIKTRVGRAVNERIVLLDGSAAAVSPEAMPVASPAPLPNTLLTNDDHVSAAEKSFKAEHVKAGKGARLSIMARAWSESGQTHKDVPRPWSGVRVVDAQGKVIADLSRNGERSSKGDPVAICTLSVDPGNYFLRHRLESGIEIEQSLVVPPDWFLHAYLLRLTNADSQGSRPAPRLSFVMRRTGRGAEAFSDELFTTLEVARIALADERRVLNKDLAALLLSNLTNPIAGIMGGHLLLIEQERDPRRDIGLLNKVVTSLRKLVGTEHPDVEALSLKCEKRLRRVTPIETPPMFARSWTLLFQESPDLVPVALWKRVLANTTLPPYLVWAVGKANKEAVRDAIVNEVLAAVPKPPADASTMNAMAEGTQRGTVTRESKKLSKQIFDLTEQNATRLQIPASALDEIAQLAIAKMRKG